jgi:hypothetical protein
MQGKNLKTLETSTNLSISSDCKSFCVNAANNINQIDTKFQQRHLQNFQQVNYRVYLEAAILQ